MASVHIVRSALFLPSTTPCLWRAPCLHSNSRTKSKASRLTLSHLPSQPCLHQKSQNHSTGPTCARLSHSCASCQKKKVFATSEHFPSLFAISTLQSMPKICRFRDNWYLVYVGYRTPDGVQYHNVACHWEQVYSFIGFDDSLRHRLQAAQALENEFCVAYEHGDGSACGPEVAFVFHYVLYLRILACISETRGLRLLTPPLLEEDSMVSS